MDRNNENISNEALVSIVILNWNGYEDTIECLQSLSKCIYNNFEIILVDNASTNGSIEKIKYWINDESFKNIHIIENPDNYGFAKGNNVGIAAALENKADYILLLNNDTVVSENVLNELMSFFDSNPNYSVATPQIRYFDRKDIIWNCGGRLTHFGSRKYFYDDRFFSELPETGYLNISFITGCAMMVKADVFRRIGMLSENFFFGEEDIEFSFRLKNNKIKIACALESVIYHKVNSSISRTSGFVIGKIYIHYLNRFINLKNYMPSWKWHLWRYSYLIYIFILLKARHKIPLKTISKFLKSLLHESYALNAVNKTTFDKYINFNFL